MLNMETNMKKHFYFFRHGQSVGNKLGIAGRKPSANLTTIGKKQAQKLSDFLSDKSLEIIYSSPLKRAVDTAHIVAKKHNSIDVITADALREAAFGFWYNDTSETQKRIDETFKRVKFFLESIVESSTFNNIAIASHGGITRALCWCAGYKVEGIKNCQCFHFILENGRWEFIESFETGIEVQNKSDVPYNLK